MLIQCTKKLLDELKIKPGSSEKEIEPLFSWHANLITLNRRKTVVLVNVKWGLSQGFLHVFDAELVNRWLKNL